MKGHEYENKTKMIHEYIYDMKFGSSCTGVCWRNTDITLSYVMENMR